MANICENDSSQRESWLAWLIVFMKRGLRPCEEFVVHGPHSPDADCMWGEAECRIFNGFGTEVNFQTSPCSSIWDIKGVRIRDKESNESFPIIPTARLPSEWQQEIREAQKELRQLRKSEGKI